MVLHLLAGALVKGLGWWYRRRMPAIQWRPLYEAIRHEVSGYPIYVETRDRSFLRVDLLGSQFDDSRVVGLAVSVWRDGTSIGEMKESAEELAEHLSNKTGKRACVLIHRVDDSFIGYYVSLGAE